MRYVLHGVGLAVSTLAAFALGVSLTPDTDCPVGQSYLRVDDVYSQTFASCVPNRAVTVDWVAVEGRVS